MEYDNTNKGVLFTNDRKTTDKQPDRTGTININGVDYWLSGWIKEGKKGEFLSLAVTPKEKKQENQVPTIQTDVDELPF